MTRRLAAAALGLACICGGSIAPRAQQTAPQKNTTGTAAISGIVVEGATNQPVAGAVVAIASSGFRVNTLTDSKGRFVARNLPAGSYSVFASCQGYAPDDGSGAMASVSQPRAPLHDNEWIADARIVLWRLGAIAGTVVDEKREPLVGARVRVLVRVPIAGTIQWAMGPPVFTDDRGVYEIDGLRKGTYVVLVPRLQDLMPPTANGTQAYPTVFYPSGRSSDEAVAVTIADGETRLAIDFMIRPVPAVSVSGRLMGPNDAPGRMPIRLMPIGTEALGLGVELASGISAPDGSFTLLGVPEGQYTLQAGRTITGLRANAWTRPSGGLWPVPPGFPQSMSFRTLSSSPEIGPLLYDTYSAPLGDDYSVTAPIVVGSTNVSDVTLLLQRSATMSGRIVQEDGSGYSPSTSFLVQAVLATGLGAGRAIYAKTGPDGSFTIDGLRPGDYLLSIPLSLKTVITPDGDYTDRPFTVTPGANITGIVATLASAPATVSGSVRDKDGRSVRNGAVILFPADPSLWVGFGTMPRRIATATFWAGADYQMTRVQAGDYYAIAVDRTRENDWQEPGFFARVVSLATRVTVAWGEKSQLNLILQDVSK